MHKFLLPFTQKNGNVPKFSPAAILLFVIATGALVSLQTELPVVILLLFLIFFGGTIVHTRWQMVMSLAMRFEIVILFWILFEPFLYGTTPLFTITTPFGQLHVYREGIEMGLLIGMRMVTLLILFLSVLSHMTLSDFISGLRSLRVPNVIIGSLLIMLRYIPLFLEEKTRMQEAQMLRGFQYGSRWERITSLGYLVGSTIDRAFNRSHAVYEAMLLRGFGSELPVQKSGFVRNDIKLLFLFVGIVFVVYLFSNMMDVIAWFMQFL